MRTEFHGKFFSPMFHGQFARIVFESKSITIDQPFFNTIDNFFIILFVR